MNTIFQRINIKRQIDILLYTKMLFIPVLFIFLITGCEQKETIDPIQKSERLELNNDEDELNRDLVE